jgi:hypothetical protein
MSEQPQFQQIRVFVSSPGDVATSAPWHAS